MSIDNSKLKVKVNRKELSKFPQLLYKIDDHF